MDEMIDAKILAVLAMATGLAACAGGPQEPMVALLDSTGTELTSVPAASVQGVPPGTAMHINVNGRSETVTVGPRVTPGVSAGTAVVGQTRRDGSLVISHVGPGEGDLAPAGTPYFLERTGRHARPMVGYDTSTTPQ